MRISTWMARALFGCVAAVLLGPCGAGVASAQTAVARGEYLANLAGCTDCHTPGHFFGKPDLTRRLGGSEVGFEVPGMGIFYGPNLTSDKETGLGLWTDAQIVHALQTGERPDGRILSPNMPWRALAHVKEADLRDIVAYLRSLPPVHNKVPGPFGPDEKATLFVMRVEPPR